TTGRLRPGRGVGAGSGCPDPSTEAVDDAAGASSSAACTPSMQADSSAASTRIRILRIADPFAAGSGPGRQHGVEGHAVLPERRLDLQPDFPPAGHVELHAFEQVAAR